MSYSVWVRYEFHVTFPTKSLEPYCIRLEEAIARLLVRCSFNPGFNFHWASLVAQLIKNPPAMRETWVKSLGWEDPLKKGKATHSSILPCRIPLTV